MWGQQFLRGWGSYGTRTTAVAARPGLLREETRRPSCSPYHASTPGPRVAFFVPFSLKIFQSSLTKTRVPDIFQCSNGRQREPQSCFPGISFASLCCLKLRFHWASKTLLFAGPSEMENEVERETDCGLLQGRTFSLGLSRRRRSHVMR